MAQPPTDTIDSSAVYAFIHDAGALEATVRSVIIGQHEVVRQAVLAVLAGGHVLLEGVPGVGKTLLVRTLGAALGLSFSRVQFTPDLMPADITGTTVLREDERGQRSFAFQAGPIFAHVVLADEVNRATPKTQSALLEAMQEGTVTVGTATHHLPSPFFVLATQNPLEMEGTYPLPEAQLDRFLLKILVPFPERDVLEAIARLSIVPSSDVAMALDGRRLVAMRAVARAVPLAAPVIDYAVSLIVATHPDKSPIETVRRFVRGGASPRGIQALVTTAQVRALLEGRYNVAIEDLQALAHPVLRHRLLLNFEAQAEGMSADAVIDDVLRRVPVP
ncbi:MAG TPA: MoxR family ATPase [Acidobacteriaceae bacterium]|nr:MoxR family ATPase [Acidobacteriaceae bacterium]